MGDDRAKPTMVEFLFGSKITRTLGWIAEEAVMEGTPEAFERAKLMVQGIERLVMQLNDPASTIALNNFQRRLSLCVESEAARQRVKDAYRESHAQAYEQTFGHKPA